MNNWHSQDARLAMVDTTGKINILVSGHMTTGLMMTGHMMTGHMIVGLMQQVL